MGSRTLLFSVLLCLVITGSAKPVFADAVIDSNSIRTSNPVSSSPVTTEKSVGRSKSASGKDYQRPADEQELTDCIIAWGRRQIILRGGNRGSGLVL